MKLTDVDLNELLPIYAQGTPISNAIGGAVASAIGAIFDRCESLPCEASQVACNAMRDDELDRVAQDLQIVIYDPAASHEEKARFVYEFAGTRYTAGSYANLKKGLSIFAKIPEWDVRIERESTWRYYIQLANPPAVSLERQRMMERLIPKAHRAVLGFDGMDIHYSNNGKSDLFTSAGNACADTLLKGETATRAKHDMILRHVREPADTNACELTPAQGSRVGEESKLEARPYKLTTAGDVSTNDLYMREDDMMVVMANSYIARKTMYDDDAGDALTFQNDYMPSISFINGIPECVGWTDAHYMFQDAISPMPVFGLTKKLIANDLIAQAYFADMNIDEQALNAACKHRAKKYCVGVNMDVIAIFGDEIHGDLTYYTQGIFAGEYPEIFGTFLKTPHNFASLSAWGEAYSNGQPSAAETWCDAADGVSIPTLQSTGSRIVLIRNNMSSDKRLKELNMRQWFSFLIPYPREWA